MLVRAMLLVLILVPTAFGQYADTPLVPSNPAFPSYRPSPWSGTATERAATMREFDNRSWFVPIPERVRVNQERWRHGGTRDFNAPSDYRPYGQTPKFQNDWHRELEQRRMKAWDIELRMKRAARDQQPLSQRPKSQKSWWAWPW